MAGTARTAPHTPEERQAIATVAATREVYDEIEQLAGMLKDTGRPTTERIDAKHALVSASERLCNLMSLAVYQLERNTSGQLQERLQGNLKALRDRLMRLSGRLMVEKLETIDKRAETVLQDRDYPIGLAGKLDMAFANLMGHLALLGGAERLGENVPELVAKTETDIKTLVEIEQKLGIMVDVQAKVSKR